MHFEQFYLSCLAHASYFIGSDGEAVVVDPRRDIDIYLDEASRHRSRNGDNHRVGANFGSDLLQHFRNGLRFYCQQNDVSAFNGFAIVGGHRNAEVIRERGSFLGVLNSRVDPIG